MSKSSWATRAGSDALSQAGPGTVTEPAAPQANDTSDLLKSILSPPVLANELGWLGHYKVERLLGRGGMGMVLLAQDTHLQRPVALKIMLPDLASRPGARERFLREARAVAALRDERIVVIYQVGQERDVPYLAMEYLHGQSLEERMRAGPLSITEIVRIGGEIAKGLAVAHQAGVIHRDVKPGNIFLTRGAVASRDDPASSLDTAAAMVKILDFGLARPVTDDLRLTGSGQFVGTPYFVSPEQARGQTVDARSDLFSLGVVLYNLCTGKLPFAGDSVMAVLTALAVDTPPAMGELRADVPASLEALVGRLLEKDAEKRPASALAVAAALEKIGAALSALGDTGVQRATAVGLPAVMPPAPAATIAAPPTESRVPRKR